MLSVIEEEQAALLTRVRGWHPGFEHWLLNYLEMPPVSPRVMLVDDPAAPHVLLMLEGGRFRLMGKEEHWPVVVADLFARNFEPPDVWPDEKAREIWQEQGRECLVLGGVGHKPIQLALQAGFEDDPEERDRAGAYFYWLTGAPRFAQMVKHPCRVVNAGLELYELMRQAIDYDEEGEYTRKCLEQGPSFVCEVEGEPVCWSCTHLGGTMGMIFTPEKHRRRGFAKSLAAFQINYMLETTGHATCHVMEWNEASQRMVALFGMNRFNEPMIRRTLFWPEEG